jgi:hypothetical protein
VRFFVRFTASRLAHQQRGLLVISLPSPAADVTSFSRQTAAPLASKLKTH